MNDRAASAKRAKKATKATAKKTISVAQRVHHNTIFERTARAGFAVNGLLHVLIGLLAISVATGASGFNDDADPGGALHAVAETPGGIVLIWVLAVGLTALALWLLLEAVLDHLLRGRIRRGLVVGANALVYGALAVPVITVGLGGRVDTDDDVRDVSAFLVQSSIGIALLVLAGITVVGIGVFFAAKGVRRTFLDDIDTAGRDGEQIVIVLGVIGYVAKGIAFAAIGALLVTTAVTVDPESAGGLDDALRAVAALPFGSALLIVVAVGLIAYGLYFFVRARRADL